MDSYQPNSLSLVDQQKNGQRIKTLQEVAQKNIELPQEAERHYSFLFGFFF